MNKTHPSISLSNMHDIGIVTKAALVCVLGVMVFVGYHLFFAPADDSAAPAKVLVAPATPPATGTTSFSAPFEATALSADGRGGETTLPPAGAQTAGVEQRAVTPSPRLYPELSSDAVRDDNGHPPSF